MRKELGQNIKKIREFIGMSQKELAIRVGKSSPAYISFIEKGERNISAIDLITLAFHLKTTVSEVIGEEPYEKKIKEYTIKDEEGFPISKFTI